MRVLLLDLCRHRARGLALDGIAVQACDDMADVRFEASHGDFDALLIFSPRGPGGPKAIGAMRETSARLPIVALLDDDTRETRIEALRKGADDVLGWPCDAEELAVHLRALVRRAHRHATSTLRCADVALDLDARSATVAGHHLDLSAKEFLLLEAFLLRKGVTLEKSTLLDRLYDGRDEPADKIIDVYVCKLRKKIAALSTSDSCIETVWGRGYRMIEAPANDAKRPATLCPVTLAMFQIEPAAA